jgi:hypothetical protein
VNRDGQLRTCISCRWVKRSAEGALFCVEPGQSRIDVVTGEVMHYSCVMNRLRLVGWLSFGRCCGLAGKHWQGKDGGK